MFLYRYDYDPDESSDDRESSDMSWHEEEQASLRQSLRTLQTQFASERARREQAEREAELLAGENTALEQQLARMEGCQVCVTNICRTHTQTSLTAVEFMLVLSDIQVIFFFCSSSGQSVGAGA